MRMLFILFLSYAAVVLSGSPGRAEHISGGVFIEGISSSAEDQGAGLIGGGDIKYELFNRTVLRPSVAFGQFGDSDVRFTNREGSKLSVFSFDILYHIYPCRKNKFGGYVFIGRTLMYLDRDFEDEIRESWTALGGGIEYYLVNRFFIEGNLRLNNFSGGYATAGFRISLNFLFKAGGCGDET